MAAFLIMTHELPNSDRLRKLADHWNSVEQRVKEAEQICQEVVMPAINELRYAGRQIVDAWLLYEQDPAPASYEQRRMEEHIAIASQYMMNADHDITDAVGSYLNFRLNQFIAKYGVDALTKTYPEFPIRDGQLRELQQVVATSRADRKVRAEMYARAADTLIPDLLKLAENIDRAAVLESARLKREKWWTDFWKWLALASVTIAIIELPPVWDAIKAALHIP